MSITGSDLKTKINLRPLVADKGGQELRHGKGALIPAMTERCTGRVVYAHHANAAEHGVIFTVRERTVSRSQLIEWQGRTYVPAESWTAARGWTAIKAARLRVREWAYTGTREVEYTSFPGVLSELYQSRVEPDYHAEVHGGYLLVVPGAVILRSGDTVTSDGKLYRVEVAHTTEEDVAEYELSTWGDV